MMETNIQSTGKADPLRDKSFHLAIRVVKLCQYLVGSKQEFVLSLSIKATTILVFVIATICLLQ